MWRRNFIASLAAAPGVRLRAQDAARPGLFFDAARLERLQAEIQTTHAALWQSVRRLADSYAAQAPPPYRQPESPNGEQLWQREVGNKLPFLALAFLLTRKPAYLIRAAQWSLACCGYPHWGAGREDGVDLAAGHQLFGLALVYDWLYADLTEDARETIRRTLGEAGATMFEAMQSHAYWRNSYLQNHLWVNAVGLLAASLALADPATDEWSSLVREKFRRTEASLGPDGASHEGVSYWSYGAEYLLKFWHLSAQRFGEGPSSPWWQQTARYRLYLGLPRNAWTPENTLVDLADCPRWDWYGPEYQLRRLAALNRDPQAQWLAAALERAGAAQYAARWLNLLWYDPSLEAQSPAALPTLHHFEDMGIVSARTGWQGDEALLVFKCGPPLGHEAAGKFDYDPGSGHVHPDANHFVLFGAGEWLLRDEGYAWKQTDHHNTLLIDGRGQFGEGAQWFRGLDAIRARAHPRITRAASAPGVDEIAGDATAIYPAESGLRRFVRRVFLLKPDVAIVVDDIELDRPRRLELRFHPEHPCERHAEGALLARGTKAALRIEPLTMDGVALGAGPTAGKDRDGKPMTLYAVRLESNRAVWRNAVALSWAAASAEPVRVTLEQSARWVFRAGERSVTVEWPSAG